MRKMTYREGIKTTPQYEYKWVGPGNLHSIQEKLNQLGGEGWHVVSTYGEGFGYRLLMERQK